jgi:pimeloyl-ACP methyl ester carboxylesterase
MELNYKTFGQGEPLIILHGLFGMLDNWQTLARKLGEHFTVFILDQRNHGRSPHAESHDYPAMAEDLKAFMERHFIMRSHLLGHSMGGKTVMQFALSQPDMVDKLIVVDMAPKAYPGGHQEIFEALFALKLEGEKSRIAVDKQLAERIPQHSIRQFLLKNLARDKEKGFRLRMNLPVIYQDYEKILAPLQGDDIFDGDALFIRGADSPYVQDEDLSLIRTLFPRAKLETIAGAGHWVHAEKPRELLSQILNFLEAG